MAEMNDDIETIIARSIGRTCKVENHIERAKDIIRSLVESDYSLPQPTSLADKDAALDRLQARVAELERNDAEWRRVSIKQANELYAQKVQRDHITAERDCLRKARTHKSTVHECYQAASGVTGEPGNWYGGNWHGATPVRERIATLGARPAIYVASKTRHATMWRAYRNDGVPINSTWIDEAGEGESACLADLWRRCINEASSAAAIVVYREDGDELKGAWIELGAALALGRRVFAVGVEKFTVANHAGITHCSSVDEAMDLARAVLAELSADSPAQRTQISDEAVAILQKTILGSGRQAPDAATARAALLAVLEHMAQETAK